MSGLAVSIRRPFAFLALLAIGCLLALALSQGQADGKPGQKCAKGAEKAGCKLPVGAAYSKDVKTGSAEGTLTATVTAGGTRVLIYSAYIDCKAFDPLIGDQVGVADDYTGKQRPKVGKTYTIKKSESRTSEEFGTDSTESELTLNFKSARQLTLTLHQVSNSNGRLLCDGSKTWTLKRQ